MKETVKRRARKGIALLLALTMLVSCMGLTALAAPGDTGGGSSTEPELKLWYDEPSSQTVSGGENDIWEKATLPIGDGDLAASVYGEIGTERLILNEKTLWTGGPSESRPNYIGGNLENKGNNGAQLKEVQRLFLEGKISEGESAAGQLVGEDNGNYGYYSPWGELNIAYDSLAQTTETLAAKGNVPAGGERTDSNYFNTSDFTFSGSWYAYNDNDGTHRGPAKMETNEDNAYFTHTFTVPAGTVGTLELHCDTSGSGVFTLSFTQKPSGYTQADVDTTASSGLLKSFTNLIPGTYTIKGTRKSGRPNLDYVKLTCMPEITDYSRWLSLDNALAGVEFTADGVNYTREYFVSNPDHVLVAHLTASQSAGFTVTLPKKMNTAATTMAEGTDTLKFCGQLSDNQEKFASFLKAVPGAGTTVTASGSSLTVTGTEVTLYYSAATDYKAVYPTYRTGETDADLAARVLKKVTDAATKGYAGVKADHLTDYHSLYNRMKLNIGQTSTNKTTDELIQTYVNGSASVGEKRLLEVMLFQYGRYLTISSSRENSILPANLQGVWNNRHNPPWMSDYHTNVNLQMNYWPTYVTNLAECGDSLVRFMESLREPGRITARIYAGIESTAENPENGFMAHTQTTPYGYTTPGWSFDWGWSPAAIAWLIQNIWEYYEYTGDVEYMRNYIYPIMREYTRFYDQFLIDKNSGKTADKITAEDDASAEGVVLASVPAYSPEHGPRTAGNTYEHSIIWQLYDDTIKAAKLLNVDADRIGDKDTPGTWAYNQSHIYGPIEIGDSGQVKEWYEETTVNSLGSGSGHRHLSHMLGLYPGDLIQTNEEWIEAARVSMSNRTDAGGDARGWSMAHRINCWARLRDGNHCHNIITYMFRDKIFSNLWDSHPPFQIDGNFGFTAGVAEMLMQSNMGFIDLLPALPDAWATGSYEGLLARGNFEVDAAWTDKVLTRAAITSKNGGECVVAYSNISQAKVTDASGNLIEFEIVDNDKIRFNTAKGTTYTITEIPAAGGSSMVEGAEALRTGDDTVVVRWTAENGKSYQVYRQIDGGEILPVGDPVTAGTYTDNTAYEALGTLKYYFAVDDAAVTTTPVTVQDLRNMGRVDDQYSLDGTSSSGSPIIFGGAWGTYNYPPNYKNTCKFIEAANVDGQTATLTFLGDGIQAKGDRSYRTQFSVSIDGGAAQSFTSNGQSGKDQLLWEITGLEYGIHTVVMTVVANKLDFDGFNVLGGGTPVDPEEPDLAISTVGDVEKLWNAGDTVQFTANLDGVTWSANVYSGPCHTGEDFTTHTHATFDRSTGVLTAGNLAETITVTATKGSESVTKDISILPTDPLVTIVEDNASGVTLTGGSIYSGESTRHHGGTKADNPSQITYAFTGTGIGVFAPKWRNGGDVEITIDGTAKGTYSLNVAADTGYDQSEIATFPDLGAGSHTITLKRTSGMLALDFFEVYTANTQKPAVDITALKNAVALAATKNEADYTVESWATLQNALKAATPILNGEDNDADAIRVATQDLNDAIDRLVAKTLTAPTGLTMVQAGGTSVTIKWNAVDIATSYDVTVNGKTVNTTGTAYQITGLESARSYTVSVVAKNSSGTSAAATLEVTTADTEAPSTPTALAYNSGTLSWTASTDNVAVTGYKVYVDGVKETDESTTPSRTLSLSESTQHSIRVIAVDAAGNESTPATLVIAPTHTVTVTNATIEGGKTSFKVGEAVTVKATVPQGHILTGWTATGVTLEQGTTETTLYFAMPDSDVTLTANTAAKSWNVITDLTNLTISGLPNTVAHGGDLSATLNAPSPYKRPATIVVTVGGTVRQSPYVEYSSVTGAITIKEITGDVVITAENAIQTPTAGTFSASDPFGLPSALGETTKLQAEYMELTGTGLTAQTGPGFGNKHISGFVDGTSLKLYYNAPVAGTYTMTLNYRSARNTGNEHTLGWSGDHVAEYAVKPIQSTLEGGTGVYKSLAFDFTVTTAGAGMVTFTTDSTNNGPELDWATFTLKNSTDVSGGIISITLQPTTATLYANEDHNDHSIRLVPTVEPADTRETIVWKSSNPEVAYVEQNGKVTARPDATGTTTITASAWHDETIAATATITVKAELSGKVSIGGAPKYDAVLTAEVNQLLPQAARNTLTYQWKLDGSNISGATERSYTPKESDIGHTLSVVATGAEPYEGSVESAAVTVTKADGLPLVAKPTHSDCTADDVNDGKITGLFKGRDYEYKLVTATTWEPFSDKSEDETGSTATAGTAEITNLAPGDYHVRRAETKTHTAGPVSETVTVLSAADSPNAHAIAIPTMEGGRVTASTRRALNGAEVTLTVAPADSHDFNDDLAVKKTADDSAVSVTDNEDGTYTFTMPDEDVKVSASFAIKTYHIQHELNNINCTMAEHNHTVNHGDTPTITLRPEEGYHLPESVKVYTKASVDADPDAPVEFNGYDFRLKTDGSGEGTIVFTEPVTEDLVVKGDGVLKTYQVYYQIPGLSAIDQPRQVQHGKALTVVLAPGDSHSALPETVSLAMGGAPMAEGQYSYDKTTGTITIAVDIITGDIIIDAVGESTLPALTSVQIIGIPYMGQRLEAEIVPADATVNYQWMRVKNGVAVDIPNATTSRYLLSADDVGATIKVRVTGTGEYGGTIESEVTATVDSAPVVDTTGVSLDRTSAKVTANGNVLQLNYTIAPADATNKMVRWSSNNEAVATVDEHGAVRGLKEGQATITVTTINGGHTATCEVTVVGLTMAEAKVSVNVGATVKVNVNIPEDLSYRTLTWTSSDEEIATVDEEGVVTGVKAGTATITVTTDTGFTASCEITVKTPSRPSTSGGSTSSGSSTTTETKEDGTKVTTETKPDGTKVETTESPDGTKEVVETKKDGTVTATTETPEGDKSVVETKPDGSKTQTVEQADGTKSEMEVTKDGDVTITVTDPEGEELVKTEIPATIPEPETKFEDVTEAAPWAEEAIDKMAGLKLVEGTGDNKYSPVAPMTRGSLATVLHRLSQGKTDYEVTFKDVAEGKYYTEGVAWAAKANVVKGISEDVFAPDKVITREQLAVMLARYAKLVGLNTKADAKTLESFTDGENTGAWAVDGMAWCVEQGILKGKGQNNLDPTADVTRAEVAVMLDRFIALLK